MKKLHAILKTKFGSGHTAKRVENGLDEVLISVNGKMPMDEREPKKDNIFGSLFHPFIVREGDCIVEKRSWIKNGKKLIMEWWAQKGVRINS